MHTKLQIFLFLFSISTGFAQSAYKTGELGDSRRNYVDTYGGTTLNGVETTGELNKNLPCTQIIVYHKKANGIAPVDKTVIYQLVMTNITGTDKCWLQQNLGASRQPTSAKDTSEAAAGWYWQFGRKLGYEYKSSRNPNTTWPTPVANSDPWSRLVDPCKKELGNGWRVPTYNEWRTIVLAKSSLTSIFASDLKLHAAGLLDPNTGTLINRSPTASSTNYWSSDSYVNNNGRAYTIGTNGSGGQVSTNDKDAGMPIRCIKD
jgi:uncharacterized protein (TIGR02145 family)